MKRHLLPLLLLGSVVCLPSLTAQAQDKPVLNTAPPGTPVPAQPRTVEPAPTPAPAPQPTVAPEPTTAPAPQPSADSPSGLNFPNRNLPGEGEKQPYKKKFIYTNFGLGYTSGGGLSQFSVSGAPALGFRLTEKFAVGPGISYAYNSFALQDGYANNSPTGALTESGANSISTSSLGLKVFAQYIVYKEFFVHAEYEVTNAQLPYQDANNYFKKLTKTVTSPLAGVGYRTPIGENAAFDIVGLYNFDNTVYSLYPGLVVRFSLLFNIGH